MYFFFSNKLLIVLQLSVIVSGAFCQSPQTCCYIEQPSTSLDLFFNNKLGCSSPSIYFPFSYQLFMLFQVVKNVPPFSYFYLEYFTYPHLLSFLSLAFKGYFSVCLDIYMYIVFEHFFFSIIYTSKHQNIS